MNKNLKSNVKKHIPKDWLCELRILYRLGKETFNEQKDTEGKVEVKQRIAQEIKEVESEQEITEKGN